MGLLLMALFGGIGGGVTRDVLLSKIPGAITNPWYLILCLTAGVVGIIMPIGPMLSARSSARGPSR